MPKKFMVMLYGKMGCGKSYFAKRMVESAYRDEEN